jgi:hypothetical protein
VGGGGGERIVHENLLLRTIYPSHNKIIKKLRRKRWAGLVARAKTRNSWSFLDRETIEKETASKI